MRCICLAGLSAFVALAVVGGTAHTYQATEQHPGSGPAVGGDPRFAGNVQAALDYLKANYPSDYAKVTFWLSDVNPTDTFTRVDSGGHCYINGADGDASFYWLAGVLIHEAQHVQDDATYFVDHPYSAEESEHRALLSQVAYLGSINSWTQQQDDYWVDGWLAKKYWITIPEQYK